MNNTAYFDNAATTFPKPEEVYQFMDSFYRDCGVNVGRGQHKLASKAATMVAETRKLMLELNHCPNKVVVFTPSATVALNIIINSVICRDKLNIYLSPFEHNAVVRPIHRLQSILDLDFFTLAYDSKAATYNLDGIAQQFTKNKPDIVIVSHASNVCGVVAPIEKICALSKAQSAVNILDMCQTMGLIDTNLNNENIDFAVFAAHKTLYGSFGLGGFICDPAAKLEPLVYGGTGIDSAALNMPEAMPERYEAGSFNLSAIAGLNASLKWIKSIGIKVIYEKEKENHHRLLDMLSGYNNIKIVSNERNDSSIGVVSCLFDGYSSDNIGQVLSDRNIAVRTGLHCAPNAHKFLGTFPAGTVRFSISYFNMEKDFEMLKDALDYIHENS